MKATRCALSNRSQRRFDNYESTLLYRLDREKKIKRDDDKSGNHHKAKTSRRYIVG